MELSNITPLVNRYHQTADDIKKTVRKDLVDFVRKHGKKSTKGKKIYKLTFDPSCSEEIEMPELLALVDHKNYLFSFQEITSISFTNRINPEESLVIATENKCFNSEDLLAYNWIGIHEMLEDIEEAISEGDLIVEDGTLTGTVI